MRSFLMTIALALLVLRAMAVQPLPTGGYQIDWDAVTNAASYSLWKQVPPSTNWTWLANATNNSITYTNPIIDSFFYLGVTTIGRNGLQSDVGVVPWPPSITTGPQSLRMTPQGGYKVPTNLWLKVSSDLMTFNDWLRFNITTNKTVSVEHMVSPTRPYLFISYPTVQPPPVPGQ